MPKPISRNESDHSESLALIFQGSAEAFVNALCADAMEHPALHHPYLRCLASGELPDMQFAIRDYCHQYYFYSRSFTDYLEAVIDGLPNAEHRALIRHNLDEELGHADAANPDQIPHTELFQRFRRAAGVSPEYDAATPASTTVSVWHELFLQKCQSTQLGVGLGAIGIGTEMIVSTIYQHLYGAVQQHTPISTDDSLFLRLHLDCDDEHADDLKKISIELAEPYSVREALRFGALSSLNLRSAFWDVMLARALAV